MVIIVTISFSPINNMTTCCMKINIHDLRKVYGFFINKYVLQLLMSRNATYAKIFFRFGKIIYKGEIL